MAIVEVTISEMNAAANTISTAAQDFEQAVATLRTATDNLQATWEGEKHDAFVANMSEQLSWYGQMLALVGDYVGMLKATANKYADTDAEAAAKI